MAGPARSMSTIRAHANDVNHPVRSPLALVLLTVVAGVLVFTLGRSPEPDVGMFEPIYAEPGEIVDIRSLGSGQTLGEVLGETLGGNEVHRLLLAFREQASPRRMRVGTEISLRFRRMDEDAVRFASAEVGADGRWLRGVDVAFNADETVRLTRDGGRWSSSTIRTPTWTDTIYAAGTIEDVLWNAVVENPALDELPRGDRSELIHHLDKIFQWQIDFSRQIQVGDSYRFAFERQVRPDGSMRAGHFIAAELVNVGEPMHAIWFDPNGDGDGTYYDLEGKSVRRAFLLKPLEFRRISSRFNPARFHPVLKKWRSHRGVDYAADRGTPIMATADGTITQRGPNGGLGNSVTIRHANGFETRYGHMSALAPAAKLGARIRQGAVIGYVGATGLATGPHLHYELWRNGQAVDPLSIDLPKGDPIPATRRSLWEGELMDRIALIEELPSPVDIGAVSRRAEADQDAEEDAQQDASDDALPDASGDDPRER